MKKKLLSGLLAEIMLLSLVGCGGNSGADNPIESEVQTLALQAGTSDTVNTGFTDVPAGADYAEAVAWCYANGILNGTTNTTFAPDATLTRSMLATAIYRAEGKPTVSGNPDFTDTQANQWYSDAVVWANAQGIIQGYGNGLFGTDDPVSVEQLQVILDRYLGRGDTWKGDPALAVPATRAQVAVALYENLNGSTSGGKVLVAYFSATGSTERVAGYIAEAMGADLFELEPVEPYTSSDLNYSNSSSRVSQEHDDPSLQDIALVKTTPDNWKDYDVVFVGYPIWWHAASWVVNRFVTDNDFSGKTVIPFCTSASSPLEGSDAKLAALTNTGNWLLGMRFSSGASQETVTEWVDTLELSEPSTSAGNVLVAYFSRTGENYSVGMIEKGNTEIVAEMIADETGANLFAIETVKTYPEGYEDCKTVVQQEIAENARPELKSTASDFSKYDVVFLGYPIWYGDLPMAVYTFMENYDWSGKTVVPFCTHAGSGLSGTVNSIKTALPGATVLDGLAITGTDAQNNQDSARASVRDWLEKLNLNLNPAGTSSDKSAVYMTTDISPEGMMAVYQALNWTPTGDVAVKLSTGEPPASNYLAPNLIKDVVQKVNGTIVECNTAYGGSRANTAMHYQVAKDHGFTDIADVVILDENGSLSLPVTGGTQLTENYVGAHFSDYDSYLVLSHFKGHAMAGFGGAIKNISIGLGSSEGKCWIHSAGTSRTSPWGGNQDNFLESMSEAGKSVVEALDGQIVYINVMNRLSVDCDCDGNPAEPDMHDIGILASTDPVALDQACIDLVYAAEDGDSLITRIESRNGLHTLEHAVEIGLGSREYDLVSIRI